MPIVIDGYNVLFAIARYGGRRVAEAIEEARTELLRRLVEYRQATGEAVTVVFDSRRGTGGSRDERWIAGVRTIHSHPPRTADDDILRHVQASGAPRQLRVVTSDRQLARACTQAGAKVVGARTFCRQLGEVARQGGHDEHEARVKHQAPSDDELRYWLEVFGDAAIEADPGLDGGAP